MTIKSSDSPHAKAVEIGARLKQARLNRDLTQTEVSEQSGLERRVVLNAEKGKVSLEDFIAILDALKMGDELNNLLPPQPISPIQVLKLRGRVRKRASGGNKQDVKKGNVKVDKDLEW